jgi:diketogulonate reductase-like aldo/keto reductase
MLHSFSGVERFLAEAIKESGVDRSDLFLTTKLWPKDYGLHTAYEAAMGSLRRLNTDYLDLVPIRLNACM